MAFKNDLKKQFHIIISLVKFKLYFIVYFHCQIHVMVMTRRSVRWTHIPAEIPMSFPRPLVKFLIPNSLDLILNLLATL